MAAEQTAEETLGAEDAKWLGEYSQVHMNVFGTPLRVMDHGAGAHVWDVDGNEYLDFLAGIAVNSIGYAHPKWVAAVAEQAAKVAHTSNYFATEPQIRLAAKLVELGFTVLATEGTARVLRRAGIDATLVRKAGEKTCEDDETIVDLIAERKVDLVINTPESSDTRRDGYAIRAAAVAASVPLVQTMAEFQASVLAMEAQASGPFEVYPLQTTVSAERTA